MPDCKKCGISLGFLSVDTYCKKCNAVIQEEEKKQRIEKNDKLKKAQEEYDSFKSKLVDPKIQAFKGKIENGEKVYLYESIYVPVDSVVSESKLLDDFSIGPLRSLGLAGWQVVGIVPKTVGIGLTNMSVGSEFGDTWGAEGWCRVSILQRAPEIWRRDTICDTICAELNMSGCLIEK